MDEQNTMTRNTNNPRKGFMERNKLSVKIILTGVLILLLFIPISMIKGLISERAATASAATLEVQHKWSGSQEIAGPVLSIPYYEERGEIMQDGETKKTRKILNYLHILPETLEISGNIKTEELKRGLYEIVVYNAPLELKGKFILPENFSGIIPAEDLYFNDVTLSVGLSDLRGISEQVELQWGNNTSLFNPGIPQHHMLSSGISAPVDIKMFDNMPDKTVDFSIRLYLKGSQSLMFAPFGKTTSVKISSNCKTPSFTGSFLPENREITESGFTCDWKVLNLNRNYPQFFSGNQSIRAHDLSTFGVDLLLPVQQYQKSMRSVKYAFLIIILTFVVSFFVEVMHKKNIHPFQYLLTGLALCLFYTLLTAISEHLSFGLSYLIAALMTIVLLTFYMTGVLKIRKTALTIGGLLTILYTYIYVLIQLETYALLAGSIGLFIILAVIMYYSQKINWSKNGE